MSDNPLPGQLALFSVTALCKPDPERLALLRAEAAHCKKCTIRRNCRQVVLGEGCSERPTIAFVGETCGEDGDEVNRPFTGKAFAMMQRMVVALKLPQNSVFYLNIVCCQPPAKRAPTKEEIDNCRDWFVGQLRCIQPQTIVALGMNAANSLLNSKKVDPITKLRGVWHEWQGIPLRVTFHPNHLLRVPLDKALAWSDMQEVAKRLQSRPTSVT